MSNLTGHSDYIIDNALVGNDLLASSSFDQTIRCWNLTTNTLKFTLTGHTNQVWGLKVISSDTLASVSLDNKINVWNTRSGSLLRTLSGHTNKIYNSIDMLSNGGRLVSGSYDQTIRVWDWSTGELLDTIDTNLYIDSLTIINQITPISKVKFYIYFSLLFLSLFFFT